MRRRFLARAGAAAVVLVTAVLMPPPAAAQVRSLYNWIHGTGDAERAFAFYRDVFGAELAGSPFGSRGGAAPEAIRPAAQAGSDPLVWDLTNTHGSRFRTVFMRMPGAPFGLELSEFFDIPRSDRAPNPWDPGAVTLIVAVRDFDAVAAKLRARSATIVPRDGRTLLTRDPDGCLIEVRQADTADVSLAITVANTARARRFYETLLGFNVAGARPADSRTDTTMVIPGTKVTLILSEYSRPADAPPARPFDWKLQDVGSPQLQLEVSGLDALIERTKQAGYRFLSVGAKPIQRAFGRFVFAVDPDGVLVEFVEPAAR